MPTLDTSVLIELLRDRVQLVDSVERAVEEGRTLYVAPHSLFELYRGVLGRSSPVGEFEKVERLRTGLVLLPFDDRAAREAARMTQDLRAGGNPIPERDLFIAASSLAWGDRAILTLDLEHFERLVPYGLAVERP